MIINSWIKDKVRIVFDLLPKTELPYKVFSKGNQLIVAFGSVPGSPIARHTENIQKISPVSSPEKKEVVLERDYEKPARAALTLGSAGSVRAETLWAFTEDEYRKIIETLP